MAEPSSSSRRWDGRRPSSTSRKASPARAAPRKSAKPKLTQPRVFCGSRIAKRLTCPTAACRNTLENRLKVAAVSTPSASSCGHSPILAGSPSRPLHFGNSWLRSLFRRRSSQARYSRRSRIGPTRSSTRRSTQMYAPPLSSISRPTSRLAYRLYWHTVPSMAIALKVRASLFRKTRSVNGPSPPRVTMVCSPVFAMPSLSSRRKCRS